ncbi:MAG: carboxypeptidase regulatory-like domain-containing protein [Planctomycetes bacterium]|nr:carboxypeptidase regulatory-like domain-containing protein [Planctomycetota bacterium]
MPRIQWAALLSCLLLPGCSGDGPTTHDVSGKVTYQGQPVADAQVGFLPIGDADEIKPARGQTDADGRYTLRTYVKPGQDSEGAMAGEFKVTITKGFANNQTVTYEDIASRKDVLPPIYADAQTTTLKASVTPGEENRFDFTLEDSD